jgi:hypothetical protein
MNDFSQPSAAWLDRRIRILRICRSFSEELSHTTQRRANFPPFRNSGVSLSETLESIFHQKEVQAAIRELGRMIDEDWRSSE